MTNAPKRAPNSVTEAEIKAGLICYLFHERRRYKLYRRPKEKNGTWYIHLTHRRKRLQRSLETINKGEALKRALILIKGVRADRWTEDKPVTVEQIASLGEIIAVYEAKAKLEIKERSVRNNIGQLRNILRQTGGHANPEIDVLPATVLTAKLVRSFKEKIATRYQESKSSNDLERARRKAWTTANSMLRQARSLFSKRIRTAYRDEGLVLPASIDGFVDEPGFKRPRIDYTPPPEEIISATFEAVAKLKDSDPNLFKAFWAAVGCGLRKSEISSMQWEWLTRKGDDIWLITPFLGKDGEEVKVPVIPDAWSQLEPLRKESGPVLEGTKTETIETVFRRIGELMKGLGWETEKKIHEMRAYIAGKIAEKYGITVAAAFLRHKDTQVTHKSYSRYFQLKGISLQL
jgi:integrase